MKKAYFITGTDTNIGKTWSAVALMRALQGQGNTVTGMKPISAGCEWWQGGWKNSDALLLQQHASVAVEYSIVNPYAFEKPVSPHIACGETLVEMPVIRSAFESLQSVSDWVLVEGAGGWFSPLCRSWDNAHLARELQLPVILIVGLRLGCINHARLTYQAIEDSGLQVAGWLAVQIDKDMLEQSANLAFLRERFAAPCLGMLPHLETADFDRLARQITLIQ